jgi:hypothetical protein
MSTTGGQLLAPKNPFVALVRSVLAGAVAGAVTALLSKLFLLFPWSLLHSFPTRAGSVIVGVLAGVLTVLSAEREDNFTQIPTGNIHE